MADIFRYDLRCKKIGKRIRDLRKEKGLSQDELASRLYELTPNDKKAIGQSTISGWEKGDYLPPIGRLIALAEIFECDIAYLLCDYDKEKKDISDICDMTGLSAAAATRLCKANRRIISQRAVGWSRFPEELELISLNTLLESDYSILLYMYQYLFENYNSFMLLTGTEETGEQEIVDNDVLLCYKENTNQGTYIRASEMQTIFLLKIQEALTQLKFRLNGNHTEKRRKK